MRKLLHVMVLAILALVLAACGGQPAQGGGGAQQAPAVELPQEVALENATIRLPEGWASESMFGMAFIGSTADFMSAVEDPSNIGDVIVANVLVQNANEIPDVESENATLDQIAASIASSSGGDAGEPTSLTLNGKNALRYNANVEGTITRLYVLELGNNFFGIIAFIGAEANLDSQQATLEAIAGSLTAVSS